MDRRGRPAIRQPPDADDSSATQCTSTVACQDVPKLSTAPSILAYPRSQLRVAPVHPIHQTILRTNDSNQPLPTFGKSNRKRNSAASSLRQDAHELNNICGRWLGSKRIVHLQSNQIAAVAQSD